MSLFLDVLYVLICLTLIAAGIAAMAHLPGHHPHPANCRPCRVIHRVLSIRERRDDR